MDKKMRRERRWKRSGMETRGRGRRQENIMSNSRSGKRRKRRR